MTGFFHKAILMSGSFLSYSGLTLQTQNWALRLAKKLGYQGSEEDRHVLEYLQSSDPSRLVEEQKTIIEADDKVDFVFLPLQEPYINDSTFISSDPIGMMSKCWSKDIDIIVGVTSDEGLNRLQGIESNPELITSLKLETLIPYELDLNHEQLMQSADRVRKTYYPSSNPNEDKIGYCKVNEIHGE